MGKLFSKERRYLPHISKDLDKESTKHCVLSSGCDTLNSIDKAPCHHHIRNISTAHVDAITCVSSKSPNLCITGGKDKKVCVQVCTY